MSYYAVLGDLELIGEAGLGFTETQLSGPLGVLGLHIGPVPNVRNADLERWLRG